MSETEHFKGKLKPTGKDVVTYIENHQIPELYDNEQEYFDCHLSEHAIFFKGQVYEIEKTEYKDCVEIFKSSKNEDGTINFEVKYYNGGCGFSDALSDALEFGLKQDT